MCISVPVGTPPYQNIFSRKETKKKKPNSSQNIFRQFLQIHIFYVPYNTLYPSSKSGKRNFVFYDRALFFAFRQERQLGEFFLTFSLFFLYYIFSKIVFFNGNEFLHLLFSENNDKSVQAINYLEEQKKNESVMADN